MNTLSCLNKTIKSESFFSYQTKYLKRKTQMKSVPLHPIRIFLCGCMEYFGEIGLPCFISTMIEHLCLPTVHGIRIQRVRGTLVAHLKNMNSLVYLSPMYFNSVNKASTWISLNSPHLMSDSGFF